MKLWRKAAGAIKDRNSIWIASISRKTSYHNPDLEAAIVKATSHDESTIDYKNSQRVFAWLRASPSLYLKPLIWDLSKRMSKTRSWVVALKGLMLMHGVFCCKLPAVQKIGRLPFDLSNFVDGYSSLSKTWGFNMFVRAYFAFLDQKSALLSMELNERRQRNKETEEPMLQELVKLQKWQILLDMLMQIKTQAEGMNLGLVLEAMDCVIIEIFDVYSRICNGIATVLVRVYGAGKIEAGMALEVLEKANVQGEALSSHFEFCREIGVLNASEFPKIERIADEDFRELERIINGISEKNQNMSEQIESKRVLETVITDKWEIFYHEDLKINNGGGESSSGSGESAAPNPFSAPLTFPTHKHTQDDFPDLITFW